MFYEKKNRCNLSKSVFRQRDFYWWHFSSLGRKILSVSFLKAETEFSSVEETDRWRVLVTFYRSFSW